MAQERTEHATPKRRERARAEGDHARSVLASSAAATWLTAIPLIAAPHYIAWWAVEFAHCSVDGAIAARTGGTGADGPAVGLLMRSAIPWLAIAVGGLSAMTAAAVSAALCGAVCWSPGALRWRTARLSPGAGIRSIFARESLAQTTLALCAATGVLLCAMPAMRLETDGASVILGRSAEFALVRASITAFWWRAALVLSALAAVDVVLARRRHAFRLRMTPHEVREERAEQEGKPEFKARRRSIASRRSRRLRVAAMKRAAAVLTNPTHVAVALEYAPPQIDVPIVLAVGADSAAAIVRTAAAFFDVPVIESPELARALFARVDVDEPIPEELYAGVAAVFAWILKTRGKLGGDPA